MRDLDFLRVVIDDTDVCPYLPDQMARMPLCVPTEMVTPRKMDEMLAGGYRRSGGFFYRTKCPRCSACEALRLEVANFKPSRSQRRAEKLGDAELETLIGPAIVDERRVLLFNEHRRQRALDHGGPPADESDYRSFLLNSPCETVEMSFWHKDSLIAISITDVAATSLSAVYCFFDPTASQFSPGTYSILKQVHLAKQYRRKWLYLGLYVEGNRHLNYKARYRPNQRLIAGNWTDFE